MAYMPPHAAAMAAGARQVGAGIYGFTLAPTPQPAANPWAAFRALTPAEAHRLRMTVPSFPTAEDFQMGSARRRRR